MGMTSPVKLAIAIPLMLAFTVVFAVSSVGAQTQQSLEDLAADQEGNLVGPEPPRYALQEDGTLVVDGDVFLDCPSAIETVERRAGAPAESPRLRSEAREAADVARLCWEQGFTPSDPDSPVAAAVSAAGSTSASATASASASAEAETLPDTGGFDALRAGVAPCALALALMCWRSIFRR